MADEPRDPQELIEAAEAAHLASRRLDPPVTSRRTVTRPAAEPTVDGQAFDDPVADEQIADRPTVRLDRPSIARPVAGARPATERPAARSTSTRDAWARLPVAAAVAAGWAAIVSFLPVAAVITLLTTVELGTGGLAAPVRAAAAGWLLGHGVPLDTPDGPVAVAPLALAGLAAWRVSRAGLHVTRAIGGRGRRSPRQAGLAAAAVAVGYGGIGALMALLIGGGDWGPPVARAGFTLAGFGLLAAGFGALRATGLLADWSARLPVVLPYAARVGLAATALTLAAGAMLAGVALAAGGGAAADVLAAYRTDVAGQVGLTLLCLAYAPNLAIWGAAYLAGPGFAVGAGTIISSSEVSAGPLPALPVFAGLPDGPLPTVGALLLAVPVVAGAIGWWLPRDGRVSPAGSPPGGGGSRTSQLPRGGQLPRVDGWVRRGLAGLLAGVVVAVALGVLSAASGGALGGGQLATFGPAPLSVAFSAGLAVAGGALLGAGIGGLSARRSRP